MDQPATPSHRQQVNFSNLPLAVYREIAAHLRQVTGVQADLVPLVSDRFDYAQSQVGYLELQYPETLSPSDRQQLEAILSFYGDRYCPPNRHPLASVSQ